MSAIERVSKARADGGITQREVVNHEEMMTLEVNEIDVCVS